MATNYDSAFSFHEQLWYYYSTNRGKIRSRYNDLTRKFLAYNDSEENPHAFLRKPQFEALELWCACFAALCIILRSPKNPYITAFLRKHFSHSITQYC